MENQTEKSGLFENLRQSIVAKLVMVGFLSLLLLVPSSWVTDLIHERQGRQKEVMQEIAQSWSSSQYISGPVLLIPYKTMQEVKDMKGQISMHETFQYIFLMPEELKIDSKASPEILHRGIFDAVVYNAAIKVSGTFNEIDLKKAGVEAKAVEWGKAQLIVGVSDVKGLKQIPQMKLTDTTMAMEPDFSGLNIFSNNLSSPTDLSKKLSTKMDFSFELKLRGSEGLSFVPMGKNTRIQVDGTWGNPSFIGAYLPEKRNVSDSSFTSIWNIPHFNRPFPQQWVDVDGGRIKNSNFNHTCGVNFLLSVDQYQKTMRSAKYAMLIIMLTFVSLLFTELITKRQVNMVQYILIGVAMIIYYSLLLSFSEQIGFTWAYIIASLATIILIGTFIATILKSKRISGLLTAILCVFYLFIYVIIQLQEMALLVGSVGLFIVVAMLMYTSSKINWDRRNT